MTRAGRRTHNVFFVANNITEIGGVQRVLHTVAAGLAARGHRVEAIGVGPGPSGPQLSAAPGYTALTLGPAEPRPWGPQRRLDYLRPVAVSREIFRRLRHKGNVARLQARFDAAPDGIVVVMQVWAMRWVRDTRIPQLRRIGMSHESFEASHVRPRGSTGPTRYERVKTLYRDVDVMLALTEEDARKWTAEGLPDVRPMPNPLSQWPARTAALDAPVVVALGRLEREKRYDLLISAWAKVHGRHPEWQLRIYGDGRLRDELQAQIDEAGLQHVVRLMGRTNEVEDVLLAASVLALSSDQEGLPLVLVEAMSAGVPCVAADCAPGIREIVSHGEDGLVVPPRDADALADGLCRLISDVALRRAAGAAARRAVVRYSLPDILDRWERLLDELEP